VVQEELAFLEAEVIAVDSLQVPEARAVLDRVAALMVTTHPVSVELLERMPNCRIVCRVGTGVDAIDVPSATRRGIWVTNVPDYSIDEVSTHALALLLALERNLRGHLAAAAAGDWRYQPVSPIRRLRGKTLGILGFGRIGSTMGRKGLGIGFRVAACDPYIPQERISDAGATPVDFETLFRTADAISLHVPLTEETRQIVNERALVLMKPTAFLVNTARGEVVDVDALLAAVQRGQLAGAAVDVLPTEPLPTDHPLLHEPRILVTPHVAWASEEAAVDVRRRAAEDVARVLRGERPRTPVNEVEPLAAVGAEPEVGERP
jgi:D-3-phosphoglycerate dehydrogenase